MRQSEATVSSFPIGDTLGFEFLSLWVAEEWRALFTKLNRSHRAMTFASCTLGPKASRQPGPGSVFSQNKGNFNIF